MDSFKVKITGSRTGHEWYKAAMGKVYEVYDKGTGYYQRADNASYLIHKDNCVRVEPKLYDHEGKKYELPDWVKYVTCDGKGQELWGWENKPALYHPRLGFQGGGTWSGRREELKEYVEPLPEGAFIKEV